MGDKPVFRVAAIGLEQRELRLIEIVFRHSQYNSNQYQLADPAASHFDLLVANVFDPEGRQAAARLRTAGGGRRLIVALPRGMAPGNTGAISVDRLALQLLPSLNKAVAALQAEASDVESKVEPKPIPKPEPKAEPRVRVRPTRSAQPLQVLVVDDSATVRTQLKIALERLGLGCVTANSASEAMQQLESASFDLALIDVVMPDSDGYKLTREIKRDQRWRKMPVIILTSRSSPFDLARGALAGCDAYLSKPVPFRALQQALVNQLRKSLGIEDLSALMRLAGEDGPSQRLGSRLARLFGR